jgi:hypothetical protein
MKKYSFLLFLAIFLLSCEPDAKHNTLSIKFNINSGTSPLQYNTNYTVNGVTIQYTDVRFYISQPVFSSGAETVEFKDAYFLGDASSSDNTFVVGDVGKRTIDGIAFGFGVDSSRNTQAGSRAVPAYSYPLDHALSSGNNMYWAWNPGYIWMKLEGKMDANADLDFADPGESFSIHTGVNNAYRFVSRTFVFTMNDAPKTIQVDMDINKFFTGYDLVANPFAHPLDTTASDYHNMVQVQDNVQLVFGNFYE